MRQKHNPYWFAVVENIVTAIEASREKLYFSYHQKQHCINFSKL